MLEKQKVFNKEVEQAAEFKGGRLRMQMISRSEKRGWYRGNVRKAAVSRKEHGNDADIE